VLKHKKKKKNQPKNKKSRGRNLRGDETLEVGVYKEEWGSEKKVRKKAVVKGMGSRGGCGIGGER